jgi:hypothetical protein
MISCDYLNTLKTHIRNVENYKEMIDAYGLRGLVVHNMDYSEFMEVFIDSKILPIIELLNAMDVITDKSCQNDEGDISISAVNYSKFKELLEKGKIKYKNPDNKQFNIPINQRWKLLKFLISEVPADRLDELDNILSESYGGF